MKKIILKVPHPTINTACRPVTAFDESLKRLAADLIDTLADPPRPAVGLAANQIGDLRRVFVIYNRASTIPPMVYVNPIVQKSRGEQSGIEGCLSLTAKDDCVISRAKIINWSAVDLNGNFIRGKLTGFDARVFLHELDHLDGITILDRYKIQHQGE